MLKNMKCKFIHTYTRKCSEELDISAFLEFLMYAKTIVLFIAFRSVCRYSVIFMQNSGVR